VFWKHIIDQYSEAARRKNRFTKHSGNILARFKPSINRISQYNNLQAVLNELTI